MPSTDTTPVPSNTPSYRRFSEQAGEGERRHATVLFADLAGFTAFAERSGEEAAYALMRHISLLMTNAVHEHGGIVTSFTGDGVMALFGIPVAFEDAPLQACRAALLIQQRLAAAAPDIEAKHGLRPQMRIGVNTGLVIVGQVQSGESTCVTALGDAVNLASRIQALCPPGGVLVSEAAYRLVQGMVESQPAGEHEIKGKADRQRVYQLNGNRVTRAMFRTSN